MLTQIFNLITTALSGHFLIAISASFIWGIMSILLSPCHLSSIPLIVGFISGQKKTSTSRAFSLSFLFSFGILVTIAVIGVITASTGRIIGDIGGFGSAIVAIVFIVMGLSFLDLVKLPKILSKQPDFKQKGRFASFTLGLIFGLALGPCTFAYMAPILAVGFKTGMHSILSGSLLVLAYAIGHTSVIVVAGTSTEVVEKYLKWNENSVGLFLVKKICGILIIAGGVYLLFY